jgi:hypothetical protein
MSGEEWFDHTKIYALWEDAFGLEITETGTPEIWTLMETSLATTDPMRKETKAFIAQMKKAQAEYAEKTSQVTVDGRGRN